MKKINKILSLLLILALALLSIAACNPDSTKEPEPEIIKGKNLIYIIGDGMGPNHIENSKLFMEKEKLAFEDYYIGDVTTHSASDAVTDSAAAATALAAGIKTNNGYVGIDKDKNELQNIMELSKQHGRKTAIVTTDYLSGATPAGFSAHVANRDLTNEIIKDQAAGKVDLLIGKRESNYTLSSSKSKFADNGFTYTDDATELFSLPKNGKIVGNITDMSNNPLRDYVAFALDYLTANNENAFTLMIEGANIDKRSHEKKLSEMIDAFINLNGAIEYVLDWAKDREDTVVIITADHETGSLAKAEGKEALDNSLYGSKDHSAANVPLYILGAPVESKTYDNTEVYSIAKSIVLDTMDYSASTAVLAIAVDPRTLMLLTK